jgi:hypothetical protein
MMREQRLTRAQSGSKRSCGRTCALSWIIRGENLERVREQGLSSGVDAAEADTEEGRRQRRELVEKITVSEHENGSAEIHFTYRFGEPVAEPEEVSHRWQSAL